MLEIYNTLDRKKEPFKPLKKTVSFYQCGPTLYWTQHIGNLRAMVLADLMRRSLAYLGYRVKFARNYTDVGHLTGDDDRGEDKMAKAAAREKKSPRDIAQYYRKIFENDIKALNCLKPDFSPRATEYISEMRKMVQKLIDRGYVYATDSAIYFDISKAKDYTRLSGQNLEQNLAAAGKGEVVDSQKKNAADFAVWFFKTGVHKNALQVWPSNFILPDGKKVKQKGFPGWHLECSAMNYSLFGPTVDIHLGGIEHVPVHHTNEIAQSQAATGKKFVNYWLHNEHLTVDGAKMSKSGGTAYALSQIKARGFDPLALRYFFLSAHYRSRQNFTWESLTAAKTALDNLREKVLEMSGAKKTKANKRLKEKFMAALGDDFNIPQAVAVMWEAAKSDLPSGEKLATILDFDLALGLGLDKIKKQKPSHKVIVLAKRRLAARAKKNWIEADRLRAEIKRHGFEIEDDGKKYKLKKISG